MKRITAILTGLISLWGFFTVLLWLTDNAPWQVKLSIGLIFAYPIATLLAGAKK